VRKRVVFRRRERKRKEEKRGIFLVKRRKSWGVGFERKGLEKGDGNEEKRSEKRKKRGGKRTNEREAGVSARE